MTSSLAPLLLQSDRIERRHATAPREWTELLLGERNVVAVPAAELARGAARESHKPLVLFPGSFNPLHHGHIRMAQIAEERLREDVWLELSIANVDKPPLDFLTIRERLDQLAAYNVCLTCAPRFVEKAELFPGAAFVVGADTLSRIADERYYHGNLEDRDAAIGRLEQARARFLVFGRTCEGRFLTLADLSLPPRLAAVCDGVPAAEFRDDVSSTDLRTASSAHDGEG